MKRTSMKKIKEVIRLSTNQELSLRQISRALNISRPVVSKHLAVLRASGLSFEDIKDLNEDQIHELFYSQEGKASCKNDRYANLSGKFEYLLKELKRPHVTLQKLWEEYIEENPNGYSRSQFFEHFSRWRKSCEISMHLEHKAGDKMFVDFTGKKLYLTDKSSGETRPVETFVAILPASGLTFVCVTENQKTENWIKATEEAFWYFGGTTCAITPDCYKSAVKKPDRFDPDINPEYSRFAEHYETVILPARPAHPKDKALVENAVKIVYHRIYASLRNEVFHSIESLNRAILDLLEDYNGRKMQSIGLSRKEMFEKIEKNSLKSLPITLYEHKKCQPATIQSNYHVYLSEDKRYYSVPYRYYSESIKNKSKIKAEIYYSPSLVEIYFKNDRIAIHKRKSSGSRYVTDPLHMPEKHRRYLERWNPERLIKLAGSKGESVALFVEKLIAGHKHPEQSYKTCRGLIFLSKTYGSARLNKACKKALYLGYISFKTVKELLNNGQENIQQLELFDKTLPEHSNIRGKEYYKTRLKEAVGE